MKSKKKVDNYIFVEEIKKGEKSTVFLVVDEKNNKLLVAKGFLIKYLTIDAQGDTNIKSVAENLINLKHENIVRIKDFKRTANNIYIITEYCNGGNLSDYQKYYINANKSQFNELLIQKIIKQIVSGLEFIHNQKIIHGDINLQNILINFNKYQNIAIGGILPEKIKYSDITLNDSFTLKISDLDISKKEGEICPSSSLMSDCPNNMAPETVQSILNNEANKTYSSKIDIWALGDIVYELLTGQYAFQGNNNEEIFKKIMEGKYIFPAKIISHEIILFINGLLQFNPEKRMNWDQIKSHDFLTKNFEKFRFLFNKNEIEINSKDIDNLLEGGENNKNKEEKLIKIIKDAENKIKIPSKQLEEVNNFRQAKERTMKEFKELEIILNQKEQLKLEEEQELKSKLSTLKEEIQTMDNFKEENDVKFKEADKLFQHFEKIKLDAEKELIFIIIQNVFFNENLSVLKTEADIINFFTLKINECNNYIFQNFGRNQVITDSLLKYIEEVFKTHPLIKEITKNIYSKLANIKIEEIKSEDEYNEKIFSLFGEVELPQFLTDKNAFGRNLNYENMTIIEIFVNIKDNKIKVLNKINKKKELLNLFILVNKKIFNKSYCDEKFITFLDDNKVLIKEYFNEDIQSKEILENLNKMTEEKEEIEKKNLLNIIENDIKLSMGKIYIIISSFYYLLLYKSKDSKQQNNNNNFGNIYITLSLKNFVIFLNESLKKSEIDLFNLLNQLYLFDCSNSIYKDTINNVYEFEQINSIFSKVGENLKNKFNKIKEEYFNQKRGLITFLKENIKKKFDLNEEDLSKFKNIKLIPKDKKVYSNTITIIVDMFLNEDKNQIDEWKDFINYLSKETMFYFFQWSHKSKEALLQNGNFKKMKKQDDLKSFKEIAKLSGKFLAYILISKKFFKGFQINLVGFGLGCYVIKECIKELTKINYNKFFVKIKNVILIGASMIISKEQSWKNYIEETVIDKFINCYSIKDETLKKFYYLISKNDGKNPIGLEPLEIKNEKGNNLVINYDFSENNFDQLSYDLGVVVKKIFKYYKDI